MNNRILLVDDEITYTVLLKEILEREGYEVHTAAKVEEAFQLSKEHPPFCLLCDLRLQNGIDGATLAGQIKRDNPYVILIAVTGHLSSFQKGYLLGSVFSDILIKPVDNDLLFHVVEYAQQKYERWKSY